MEPTANDWRQLVRQHADKAHVDLPQATVDEIALHLEDIYGAARAEGLSAADAHVRAMAALEESPLSQLRRHASRDSRRPYARAADVTARGAQGRSLSVLSAIRLALRQFRQHPTFAIVTVLVLGLGTGAATTVFTIVDAVVLRPLPYQAPDRLVTLWDTNTEKGLAHDPISPVNFMDYRALPVFKDAAAWWRPGINLIDPGMDPVRVNTIEVGGNIFDVLGIKPQVGAGFPVDGPMFVPNELVAVISDRLWRTRYSANPSIVGRQLSLNGTPYTVVGVMPAKFHYPDDIDVWQRLRWDLTQHSRAAHFMEAVGRLSDGTTFDQAQSGVEALALRLQNQFPQTNKGWASRLVPLLDEQLGYYRPALMVLFGAVALLLVIGCLNVASLLLTRALSREKEVAVRIAMGAAPRQLVTQLLAESLVLSVVGAVIGVIATVVALPIIQSLTPLDIPRLDEATVDIRALALGLAVVVVTTIFFGLVPALLLLRGQLSTDLKSGERGSSRGARRIYSVLVAGEVALACALLVASALLVRTVGRMTETPTGIDAESGGHHHGPTLRAGVQLVARRRPDARRHHRADSSAARCAGGGCLQLPAAGGGMAGSVWHRWTAGACSPRRCATSAVSQCERGLLRGPWGANGRRPRLRGVRHSGVGTGGHRQRDVRQALPQRRCSGRPRHHVDDDRDWTTGIEPHTRAPGPAARSATAASAAYAL